jgi:hypothetical protein
MRLARIEAIIFIQNSENKVSTPCYGWTINITELIGVKFIIEFVRPTTRFGDLNFDWQKDNENCNR